jgi:serine phosphatase RsbU (regulator of sigma subunit)/anti-sigma regulatory factor (Ser/Thr protein kinase)/PAS domain-containing protein
MRKPAALIVRGMMPFHANDAAGRLFAGAEERAHAVDAAQAVFFDGEARVYEAAGRELALAPLFDAVGDIEAVLLVESPLGRLPKMLNAFQEPMRHFSRIVHSLPHPVLAARPNGTIDFLSDSWYELVGERRSLSDPAGSFERAVPPEERATTMARILSGAAGQVPFSFRVPLITQTGPRWFDVTLRPLMRDGLVLKWVGAIGDVDAEVRSRRSLARSQRHLRFVSEAADVFARAESIGDLAATLARLGAAREEAWGFVVVGLATSAPGGEILAPGDALAIEWKLRAAGEAVVTTLADGRAVVAVPLHVLDAPGFLFVIAPDTPDELSERTLETARDIAQRLRPALERRVMLEREQRISAMLQRAMLPLALPAVHGVRFDIAYAAASDETSVGGDWYDAFELGDGRVALVIGDIAGHGLDAAIIMGSIRQVMRAVSLEDSDPAAVLARVNRTLAHEHGALASVFYGVLDPMTLEFTYGNAGHPPPYVVADGRVQALPMNGIILGSQEGAPAQTQRMSLPPDGAIVLYTDGIIERSRDIMRGEQELQAVLQRWSAGNFTARSADLQNELLAGGPRHDDAAMFIVRVDDDGTLDVSLPASLRNATRMRNAFERFVRRRGFCDERVFEITLGVAEAINNAAEHAYGGRPGTIRLSAHHTDRWLEATVSDAGRWREQPSDPDRGRGIEIIRRVFDDVDYTKTANGTSVSLRTRLPEGAAVFAARG